MNYEDSTILSAVKKAIEATVNEFHKTPFDFLSERDIQARLYMALRNETKGFSITYDGNKEPPRFNFHGPFDVHPVTIEYFYKCINARFDVAVLSSVPDESQSVFRQPCRVGIEIKLWQPGELYPKDRKDVEKLQEYHTYLQGKKVERKFMGIVIVFVHPNIKEERVQKYLPTQQGSSSAAYPEDGIALHWVTKDAHWWEQS